jgi:hypothetical protein
MFKDSNQDEDAKGSRRQHLNSRLRPPRATRSTRRKKRATGFGGAHQRRNKHWSW